MVTGWCGPQDISEAGGQPPEPVAMETFAIFCMNTLYYAILDTSVAISRYFVYKSGAISTSSPAMPTPLSMPTDSYSSMTSMVGGFTMTPDHQTPPPPPHQSV
uniref:Uncharacterized protein n=1 Tax=Cacopsylla melanoneura TaxID=428564 RepID=A0A8D9BPE9_9HEMI